MGINHAIRYTTAIWQAIFCVTLCSAFVFGLGAQELAVLSPRPVVVDVEPAPRPAPKSVVKPADVEAFDSAALDHLASDYDRVWMALTDEAEPGVLAMPIAIELPVMELHDQSVMGRVMRALGDMQVDADQLDEPLYAEIVDDEMRDRLRDAGDAIGDSLGQNLLHEYSWLGTVSDVAVLGDESPTTSVRLRQETAGLSGPVDEVVEQTTWSQRLVGENRRLRLEPDVRGLDLGYRMSLKNDRGDDGRLFDSSSLGVYSDGEVRAKISRGLGRGSLSLGAEYEITGGDQEVVLRYSIGW